MTHAISIDEGQRQLILLALATLALERPGFDYALAEIAKLMDNPTSDGKPEMYEDFKRLNLDKYLVAQKMVGNPGTTWAGLHSALDQLLAAWCAEADPPNNRPRIWETGSIKALMEWSFKQVKAER